MIGNIIGAGDISALPSGVNNSSELYVVLLENGDYVFSTNYYTLTQTWWGDGKGDTVMVAGKPQKVVGKLEIAEIAEAKIRREFPKLNPSQRQAYLKSLYSEGAKRGLIGSAEEQIARFEANPSIRWRGGRGGYGGSNGCPPFSAAQYQTINQFETYSGCRINSAFTEDEFITALADSGISREDAVRIFAAIAGNRSFKPENVGKVFVKQIVALINTIKENATSFSDGVDLLVSVFQSSYFSADGSGLDKITSIISSIYGVRGDDRALVQQTAKGLAGNYPAELVCALEKECALIDGDQFVLLLALKDSLETGEHFSSLHFIDVALSSRMRGLTPELYEKGKTLAIQYAQSFSPEIWLNFSYAVKALGEQKTIELFEATGIVYFARYSVDTLKAVYENLDPRHNAGKPLLLVHSNRNSPVYGRYNTGKPTGIAGGIPDHNGAFYAIDETLEPLFDGYRVIIIETGTDVPPESIVKDLTRKYGLIHAEVLAGHGNRTNIAMGTRHSEDAVINSEEDREKIRALKPYFVSNPVIVCIACSTAQAEDSIVGLYSQIWPDGEIYGPVKDPDNARVGFSAGEKGTITDVRYTNALRRKMHAGRTVSVE